MSGTKRIDRHVRNLGVKPAVGWGLLVGGALFFVGGSMHPKDDPHGVSLLEQLQAMFDNPAWYPSHALQLAGMALLAASLVAMARGGALASVARAQKLTVVAAFAGTLATVGMLVHLSAALEAAQVASRESTPIVDAHLVAEVLTVPAFGFAIAGLALVGGVTRALGNRVTAVLGTVGGVGYGLAGATFLLTDALNFLFPLGGAIGLWAFAAGIGVVVRSRSAHLPETMWATSSSVPVR